jgi:hypothetical protein
MEQLTFALSSGVKVLAHYKNNILCPYQYIARSQAEKKALEVGGEVIRPTRAYLVKLSEGIKQ